MKATVVSYSLSHNPSTLKEWKEKLIWEIRSFNDSEIILYPELFLMGLAKYTDATSPVEEIIKTSELLHRDVLPFIKKEIITKSTIVLGTGPRSAEGRIFNSAPVLHQGEWLFQDKLYLTPWETEFTPGIDLKMFNVSGLKACVVICFDSEQPDLSLKLKQEKVDLILVPSATTNRNGSQRVNRCASARSVELGAVVLTSPLIGDSKVDLVDHNEGRAAMFLPAQESMTAEQEQFSEYSTSKHIHSQFSFSESDILKLKVQDNETKPFLKTIQNNIKIIRV